jgi:hypothetical protein
MRVELDLDQIFEILTKWYGREYGQEINALQWQVEEDKEFEGVIILYGP